MQTGITHGPAGVYLRSGRDEAAFLESALTAAGALSRQEVFTWIERRLAAGRFHVDRIPFADLGEWSFEEGTGDLAHRSGKFFRIEGVDVLTNFGPTPH